MISRQLTLDLDYLEISAPSSPDLRQTVGHLLENSDSYNAAVASLDHETGVYEIILKGRLGSDKLLKRKAT